MNVVKWIMHSNKFNTKNSLLDRSCVNEIQVIKKQTNTDVSVIQFVSIFYL